MPDPLIIIGASARAAAQSAIRAGCAPWCIDLFADRDLRAVADVRRCPADRWPGGVLDLLTDAPDAPVLLTGAMENHLDVVRDIARSRPLLGSSVEAIESARDPLAIPRALDAIRQRRAVEPSDESTAFETVQAKACATFVDFDAWRAAKPQPAVADSLLLLKPRRGAVGRGIRFWRPPEPFDAKYYLQQYITGAPISAVCFAADDCTHVLGVSDLLIGDKAFGATGFQFVGAITPSLVTYEIRPAMAAAAEVVARHCGLRGLFGIDTVFGRPDGAAYRKITRAVFPVEINPRYTASVEVVERALNHSAFTAGSSPRPTDPPAPPAPPAPQARGFHGKAFVYAKADSRVRADLRDLAGPGEIADLPDVGAAIVAGQPICTVLAAGVTQDECLAQLREMAARVFACVH